MVVRLDVGADEISVNVMGGEMPLMPDFDELEPKSGKVRGYVKDANGNPLDGAEIGLKSLQFVKRFIISAQSP